LGVFLCLGMALARTYTVLPGDTLWRIARNEGVELTVLLLANHLQGTELKPGQTLVIPEKYTVVGGDTLWSLARRYGTTVAEIKHLNGLTSNSLRVGQELWLVEVGNQTPPGPGDRIADVARAYLGRPYRYGATGPNAFDCSGYVQFVYRQLGYSLPRTAAAQWSALSPVPEPEVGDLVFFSFSGQKIDHVGIYLGNGLFIHANSYKNQVVTEPLNAPWYKKVYRGARRVETVQTPAEGLPAHAATGN